MPMAITMPMAWRAAAPAPVARISGRTPRTIAELHHQDAVLGARLATRGDQDVAKQRRGSFGMIAAIAERPNLLDPIRAAHKRIWKRLNESGKDPELALVTWFALEGLLFVELFGTSPLSKAERGKFLKRLEAIAAQSSG